MTQKEDHYEVLIDVIPDAKEIPSLMENNKPKREHHNCLTMGNLFGGIDNEIFVRDPTFNSHEYEIDPARMRFKISTVSIDWQKYCHTTRENGTRISIAPS